METGRTVIEVQAFRRLSREYAPDGSLLRILIEPLRDGPSDPPPAPMPRAVQGRVREAPSAPVSVEPASPPPTITAAPNPPVIITEPYDEPPPASARSVIVLRYARPRAMDIARRPETPPEIILQELRAVQVLRTARRRPVAIPVAARAAAVPRGVSVMRYAARRFIDIPRPSASPIEAALAAEWKTEPAPLTFEILAIERIDPAPPREPPAEIELEAIEAQDADPIPPEIELEAIAEARDVTPAPVAIPEPPEIILEPYEDQRPNLAQRVPDVDERVDALLASRAGKPMARRRAPLAVPRFEPLRDEPWQARLDAVLSKQ